MKKLIPIIISAALLFTIAQFKDSGPMEIDKADAWGLMMGAAITGSGGAPAACNQLLYESESASTGSKSVGSTGVNDYYASRFTVVGSGSETICRIDLNVNKAGSGSATTWVGIWNDDGSGDPNNASIIDNSDNTDGTGFPTNDWFPFTSGISATITLGTEYHMVFYSAFTDGSNYSVWNIGTETDYVIMYDGDGVPPWSDSTADRRFMFRLYTQ